MEPKSLAYVLLALVSLMLPTGAQAAAWWCGAVDTASSRGFLSDVRSAKTLDNGRLRSLNERFRQTVTASKGASLAPGVNACHAFGTIRAAENARQQMQRQLAATGDTVFALDVF